MKHSSPLAVIALAVMLFGNSGCLFTRHATNVIRKNEKPKVTQFESPQAKNLFDGKVAEVKSNPTTSNPRLVAIPFLLWYSSTDVVSDNGIYNDQVAICDTDGNGAISMQEAMTYVARIDAEIAKRQELKAKSDAQMARFDSEKPTVPAGNPAAPIPSSPAVQPASVQQPIASPQPYPAEKR